jgi:hypothetical protein
MMLQGVMNLNLPGSVGIMILPILLIPFQIIRT